MAALIHIDGQTYQLPLDPGAEQVAADIQAALQAKSFVTIQTEVSSKPLTLYVNTNQVGVIVLDWDGTGAGFFHG